MSRALLGAALAGLAGFLALHAQQIGPNVNVMSGIENELTGDPFLQRQNEAVVAVSSRNADHIMVAMNDYRTVAMALDPAPEEGTNGLIARNLGTPMREIVRARAAQTPPEAWIGLAFSQNRGRTWYTALLPGSPFDTSERGQSSPLYGLSAGSDPVLVAGPHGRFYLGGLAFDRGGYSTIFVARFTDENNVEGGETIRYDFARLLDKGSRSSKGLFTDKPSIAVYAGEAGTFSSSSTNRRRGRTPVVAGCERVYMAWTRFEGLETSGHFNSSVWVSYSASCGDAWAPPLKVSGPYTLTSSLPGTRNQGTAIAIDPLTGHVYVVWRVFHPHGFVWVRSTDGGLSFSAPRLVTGTSPVFVFDQPTIMVTQGPPTFRTNAYPTAVFHAGKLVVAWQERVDESGSPSPTGSPRIVVTFGTPQPDGTITWTPRRAVDVGDVGLQTPNQRCEQEIPEGGSQAATVCRPAGPQVQPHLVGGDGRLFLFYYEASRRPVRTETPSDLHPTTGFVSGFDRTVEVRLAVLDGDGQLLKSEQVSRYSIDPATGRIVERSDTPLGREAHYANAPLYRGGLAPFIGDYLHAIPLRSDGSGPGLRVVWTDNRFVRFPQGNDFTKYDPPGSGAPECNPGSRDSTIMTSEVQAGLIVGSLGNFKQLVDSLGNLTQRAFTVYVENLTDETRRFRLSFGQTDAGVTASFEQFSSQTAVDVEVLAGSSVSRSAFLSGPVATGSARVDVQEIDTNGTLVPGGLAASVTLNGDPTNPFVGGAGGNAGLADTETHDPQLGSPQLGSPQLGSPQLGSPQLGSPQLGNPQIGSPQLGSGGIQSPQIGSASFTDITVSITNGGNTASAYNFLAALANAPQLAQSGHGFQVFLLRVHRSPTSSGCGLAESIQQQIVFQTPQLGSPQLGNPQVGNPQLGSPQLGNPQLGSPQLGSSLLAASSVSIAPADPTPGAHDGTIHGHLPRDEAILAVRVIHPPREDPASSPHTRGEFLDNFAVAVEAQAANTGETEPRLATVGPAGILCLSAGPLVVRNTCDSGPGSLRQAVLDANSMPGPDTITFNIPGTGPYTIRPLSALPAVTDSVVIDGSTQPGFAGAPVVILDGAVAGAGTHGLVITAGSSTIRGLVINRFGGVGIRVEANGNNVIEGNYIGTDETGALDQGNGSNGIHIIDAPGNTIGGSSLTARNVISGNGGEGIRIDGASATGNLIQGNYIGTNAAGTADLGNSLSGVYIRRAPGNSVIDNVVSGNDGFAGIAVCGNVSFCGGGDLGTQGNDASGTILRGNRVGTSAAGTAGLGNSGFGVSIDGAPQTIVGGDFPGESNLISANGQHGVILFSVGASGNLVRGNLIGTDITGTNPLGNGGDGVRIESGAATNTVGGTTVGTAQNTIAFNGGRGISVVSNASTGNLLRFNRLDQNGGLGIDLGADGVTGNDEGDADAGPNDLQNFPVLTAATVSGGTTTIQGELHSTANTQFVIDFFNSPACDPAGHGEGQTWFASLTQSTDGNGDLAFQVNIGVSLAAGSVVTALATSPGNSTSEFSACVTVTVGGL